MLQITVQFRKVQSDQQTWQSRVMVFCLKKYHKNPTTKMSSSSSSSSSSNLPCFECERSLPKEKFSTVQLRRRENRACKDCTYTNVELEESLPPPQLDAADLQVPELLQHMKRIQNNSSFVDVPNVGLVRTAQAVKLIFAGDTVQKSSDRMKRAAGYLKSIHSVAATDSANNKAIINDDIYLARGDPVGYLAHCGSDGAVALCIMEAHTFSITVASKTTHRLTKITEDQFRDSKTTIWGNLSTLEFKDTLQSQVFHDHEEGPNIKVMSSCAVTLSPQQEFYGQRFVHLYQNMDLKEIKDQLWLRFEHDCSRLPNHKLLGHIVPYKKLNDRFLVDLIAREKATQASTSKVQKSKCSVCELPLNGTFAPGRVVGHISWHLHHDAKSIKIPNPCGLCGLYSAVSTNGKDNECAVWIEGKGKNTKTVFVRCCHYTAGHKDTLKLCQLKKNTSQKYPNVVEFKMKTMSNMSKSAPCTNIPIECPHCPLNSTTFIWRDNMEYHMAARHPKIVPTEQQIKTFELHAHEFSWLDVRCQLKQGHKRNCVDTVNVPNFKPPSVIQRLAGKSVKRTHIEGHSRDGKVSSIGFKRRCVDGTNEFTFDVMYKKAKRESQNILKEDLDLPSLKLLLQDPMSGDNDDEEEEEEEE